MSSAERLRARGLGEGRRHNSTELSLESSNTEGCNMESFGSLSPIGTLVPRKLDFSGAEDEWETAAGEGAGRAAAAPNSPPYKRVRALRLFDSPATPKTILEKCSTPTHPGVRSRFSKVFGAHMGAAAKSAGSGQHLQPPLLTLGHGDDSALGSLPPDLEPHDDSTASVASMGDRRANVNPFTPDGQLMNKKKRALSKTPTSSWESTPEQPAKRLKESNISRYYEEFVELGVLGKGQFGLVTKCLNRLDGCVYALKRSLRPVAGSVDERSALNEVYAHAALGKHPHVVRYFSAWAEDDHMIIQNEYCDGGCLQELVPLREGELLVLLAHVAAGLAYIHSMQLVHMDIKPGNIFVCRAAAGESAAAGGLGALAAAGHDSADDGFEEHEEDEPAGAAARIYKIGDLGHVTCVSSPQVEEGDCRYLPKEVLQEDFSDLTKADIFAFGMMLFEAGGGGPLPKNGELWHKYREGALPDLPGCSRGLNQLLKQMVAPSAALRPSAAQVLRHPALHPAGNKSKAELRRELAAVRLNNQLLERKLQEAARCIKSLTPGLSYSGHDSAKVRTRSAKTRAGQRPAADGQRLIAEILQSVACPVPARAKKT